MIRRQGPAEDPQLGLPFPPATAKTATMEPLSVRISDAIRLT